MVKKLVGLRFKPADRNRHFDRLNLRIGTLRWSRFCDIRSEKSTSIFINSPISNSMRLQNHFRKFTSVFVGCIAGLFAVLGIQNAAAESGDVRGIWYDVSGIDQDLLEPQIAKFKKLGISRVHIVVSERISDMGLSDKCKKKGGYIEKCAADQYIFGFDKWIPKNNSRPQLGQFVDRLKHSGFKVILTIWPVPTKHYIGSLGRLTNFIFVFYVFEGFFVGGDAF